MPDAVAPQAMRNSPLVSVVTPFYNTRDFLEECIQSVLRQTWQCWEYLLVDNHSTDGSSEIAREYAARCPDRIRVIRTPEFLSQVANYSFALTQISPDSKYCKVVQADDWIFPECLERMVALAETDPTIGMVSSHYLRASRTSSHVEGFGLPCDRTVVPGREICRLQLHRSIYVFGSPTVPLYRSEVVRSTTPFYDEKTLHDDTDAHYRLLQRWNFGFVHQVLSCLRVREDSIRGRVLDFNPDVLDWLLQLSKFGPGVLQPDEFSSLLHSARHDYYTFLARSVLSRAPQAFWQYHISGLESGGLRLEKARLWKYFLEELLRLVANPGSTCSRIVRRLRSVKNAAS